jgi:hypothetical protein
VEEGRDDATRLISGEGFGEAEAGVRSWGSSGGPFIGGRGGGRRGGEHWRCLPWRR